MTIKKLLIVVVVVIGTAAAAVLLQSVLQSGNVITRLAINRDPVEC